MAASSTFSIDEIVEYLQIFDSSINKSQFLSLKPDFIQLVYSYLISELGTELDELNKISPSAPECIQEYPDMFKTVIYSANLTKRIRYCLSRIYGPNDFKICDLLTPNLNRTVNFISLLLRFGKFVLENQDEVGKVILEVEQHSEEIEKLKKEIEERKLSINKLKMQEAEYEVVMETEERNVKSRTDELQKIHEDMNRRKGRYEGIAAEINELSINLKKTELQELQMKEEIENLKSKVILEEDLQSYEESQSTEKSKSEEIADLKQKIKTLRQNIEEQQKLKENSANLSVGLDELERNKKLLDEWTSRYNEDNHLLNVAIKELEEINQELQFKQSNLPILEDQKSRLLVSKENVIKEADGKCQDLARKNNIRNKCLNDIQNKSTKLKNEIKNLEDSYSELKNSCHEYIKDARDCLTNLLQKWIECKSNLDNCASTKYLKK